MIKEAIGKIVVGTDLDEAEMVDAMNEIMSGECTPAQIGSSSWYRQACFVHYKRNHDYHVRSKDIMQITRENYLVT